MFVLKRTAAVLISICILLLGACGPGPAAMEATVPITNKPSPTAAGNSAAPGPGHLYNGFHPDTLMMTIPVISEEDQTVFNPNKVYDYLATSFDASHDYAIRGAEFKGGKLYLTIEDNMFFYNPELALNYLEDVFSLSDEEILALPEFSGCYKDSDGFLDTGGMRLSFKSRMLGPIPVSADTVLGYGLDWEGFLDYILDGNTKKDGIDIGYAAFMCSDTEITGIVPYYGWMGLEGYNGNDDMAGTQYAGDEEWELLPGSVPIISEADLKTFNPDIIENYLQYIAGHYYSIKEAELKDGVVYLTIQDSRYLYDIGSAYDFLRYQFSLSDDEILALPIFSGCLIKEGIMYTGKDAWNEVLEYGYFEDTNYFSINDITLNPIPLSTGAEISLLDKDTYERYEITYDDFVNLILDGKSKNSGIDFYYNMSFKYENGKITAIYEYDENGTGDDYGDEGGYVDEGEDEGNYEDETTPIDRENLTGDVFDPLAAGYGPLPKSLLGIREVSTVTFDPDKVVQYLLAGTVDFEENYFIERSQVLNGCLSLYLTDYINIDADDAYQYLIARFPQSADAIKKLPLFSGCSIHNGKMYTPEEWDYENGIEPEWCEEYNLNRIELTGLAIPAVPVAGDAQIILVDYDDTCEGYYLTAEQFKACLLNGHMNIGNVWFKYSDNKITALIEEYSQ